MRLASFRALSDNIALPSLRTVGRVRAWKPCADGMPCLSRREVGSRTGALRRLDLVTSVARDAARLINRPSISATDRRSGSSWSSGVRRQPFLPRGLHGGGPTAPRRLTKLSYLLRSVIPHAAPICSDDFGAASYISPPP